MSAEDVELEVKVDLNWKERVQYRVSKTMKSLSLLKRNTHPTLT